MGFAGSPAYIAAECVDTTWAFRWPRQQIKTTGTKIATETLNVRSGPSKSHPAVGSLPEGSRVRLTGPQHAGFAQIRCAGRRIANVYVEAWQDERAAPIASLHGHFLVAAADSATGKSTAVLLLPEQFASQAAPFFAHDAELARHIAAGDAGYRYADVERLVQRYNQGAR